MQNVPIRDDPERVYQLQKAGLAWLIAYLLTLAVVIWAIYHARAEALKALDTPEARAEWEAWRQATNDQNANGPVRRRKPAAVEPPTLVLLRDYFAVVLGAGVVFSSVLFATTMIVVRGAVGRRD